MGNKTRHTANLVSDNNLFVDIANDRVGIGSTQPTAKLNVAGIVSATSFIGDGSQLSGVTVTGNASLQQLTVSGNIAANGNIVGDNSTNITGISGVTAGSLTVSGNITANGNIVGDNATNISGVNQVTATTFSGSGASLTGLTGASAATYGGASVSPQITVDANGRITSISNVSIAGGGGGGGSSIIVQDSQSVVGAAGTIDFGTGLSVSAISAGVATVTSAGISTHDVSTNTLNVTGVSTFTGNVSFGSTATFGSNDEILLGDSQELSLKYSSSSSGAIISAGGNPIDIKGTAIRLKSNLDENIIVGTTNDSVSLYYDNSKKFETKSDGVDVTGEVQCDSLDVDGAADFSSGNVNFQGSSTAVTWNYNAGLWVFSDNAKAAYGSSNDLQIYHNGTNSHIENGTGQLLIRAKTGENSINCIPDGQVELYHNNSKRFETTSTGVSISGNIDAVTDISCNSIANNAGGGATWILNNTGNATFTGTVTANTFSGSGASLTNLPAANLTGTLPAISGANLTNLPAPTPADTDVQVTFDVSSNGSSAYRITGPGYSGADDNPDIYLVRGQRYRFINGTGSSHPFRIQSDTSGTAYTDGVSGSQNGTQDFNVQHDAPVRLYYQCTIHSGMIGNIYVVGASDWRMTDVATNATPDIFTFNDVGIGTDNPNSLGKLSVVVPTTGGAGAINVQNHAQGSGLSNIVLRSLDNNGGNWADAEFRAEAYSFKNRTTERLRIASDGSIRVVGDNQKLTLGAGNDFELYHDGSDNVIATDGPNIRIGTTGETFAKFDNNGAAELYYDNSKKFETRSNGTQTTGRIYINGTNGGFDYNNIAHTLEFLVSNGSTHSELTHNAFVPSASGTRHLGYANKRWDTLYVDKIAFGGAANTDQHSLDDYEEGTWTPNFSFNGNSTGLTYSNRGGVYTKVGRLVTCYCMIVLSNKGSSTGNALVSGLPFTATDLVAGTSIEGGGHAIYQDDTTGTHTGPIQAAVINSQSYFDVYRVTSTNPGHSDVVTNGNVTNTSSYRFVLQYTAV